MPERIVSTPAERPAPAHRYQPPPAGYAPPPSRIDWDAIQQQPAN
ncbi:hypothetical protein [Streptomyces sp. NPDC059631]